MTLSRLEVEDVAAAEIGEVLFRASLTVSGMTRTGSFLRLGGAGVDAVVDGHLAADEQLVVFVLGMNDDALGGGERPHSFRLAASLSECRRSG